MRCLSLIALMICGSAAGAQSNGAFSSAEVRADVIATERFTSYQAGAAVRVPLGYYVRLGVGASAGVDAGRGNNVASGRFDAIARFLLDPFRQSRWALSAGGGASVSLRGHESAHPHLVAVVDLEGPRSAHGWATAFQVGLGGGIRIGAALRGAAPRTR